LVVSCGETCCAGEVVERGLVCVGGCPQRWGGDLIGEPGRAGGEESVVDGGQVHRGVQAVVGDLVSVGVRDAGDEAAGAEAVQVIGHR
jgi:hypothetical protein